MPGEFPKDLKRLLVIKPSSLGDIVHGLQVLQSVIRQLPDCHVTWVARDRFAGLVRAAPFVHEVIEFERKRDLRGLLGCKGLCFLRESPERAIGGVSAALRPPKPDRWAGKWGGLGKAEMLKTETLKGRMLRWTPVIG